MKKIIAIILSGIILGVTIVLHLRELGTFMMNELKFIIGIKWSGALRILVQ